MLSVFLIVFFFCSLTLIVIFINILFFLLLFLLLFYCVGELFLAGSFFTNWKQDSAFNLVYFNKNNGNYTMFRVSGSNYVKLSFNKIKQYIKKNPISPSFFSHFHPLPQTTILLSFKTNSFFRLSLPFSFLPFSIAHVPP